jgi:glycosyltransferase involved in cell wall biosynthesis
MPSSATLIIPCYDEADRLDTAEFLRLARSRPGLSLLFVDDGSRDGTMAVLERLAAEAGGAVRALRLERNRGKAEAVRQGLRAAIQSGAALVGYADADLSTPVDELVRLVAIAERSGMDVVLGSRVKLLGRRIDRRGTRHYVGRVFATFASIALRLPVYDTQCGAKVFRVTPALGAAVERPFRSRWIFDVELLARLTRGSRVAAPIPAEAIIEVPLRVWRDVAGSKLRLRGMIVSGVQILALALALRLRRARPFEAKPRASEAHAEPK